MRIQSVACILAIAVAAGACQDPFAPIDLRTYTDVTTGGDHTCAIDDAGQAWCWGRGADGELGTGSTANQFTPAKVASDVAFKQISAGDAHTCALAVDGRIFCWGWNAYFQTGVTRAVDLTVPQPIDGGGQFTSVSAGAHHTCAVAIDAQVWCWGYNRYGQSGNGDTFTKVPPFPIVSPLRAKAVSAGGHHSCALSTTGEAYCWGMNDYGQLGIGSDTVLLTTATPVATSLRFSTIDAGATHTCAVAGGNAYCWGSAIHGEIGDGAPFKPGLPGPNTPTQVRLLSNVTAVSTGVMQSCAVDVNGTACWGYNAAGQLGNGTTGDAYFPQGVYLKSWDPLPFSPIAAGGYTHTCGINTGHVYCWGSGQSGQLGGSTHTFSTLPQRVRQ
ncbi:MAG TPA: hypothetical protein VF021_05755 [Longimicrobiales bacterium]